MYQFIYDKRDLIEYPTSGYYINFSQDFAGLGGDKHYVSSELSTRFYKTLFYLDELKSNKNAIVFQLKNNFGVVNPYNNYVLRIEDRFFLSEFRGFRQVSGISPRDHEKKPIGGDKYFFGSAQIEMPINLFQDFDIKGHVFVDYGKVLVDKEKIFSKDDLLNDSSKIFNSEKIRVSAGIGLYIITPIAPIQVAIGKPLRWESELDHRKYIYFSLNKRI
jgi:outer membrane protein insertion porin family